MADRFILADRGSVIMMSQCAGIGFLAVLLVLPACAPSWGHEPIWAKGAVNIQTSCDPSAPIRIPSPDGLLVVEVRCGPADRDGDPKVFLTVTEPDGTARNLDLPEGAEELLWAPDSKRFLVNGSECAYAGYYVRIYDTQGGHVAGRDITSAAQRDMVALFPPCKAAYRHDEDCKRIEKEPEYNMSGLAWTRGGAAVAVFAEVPCTSTYGGIMCQVEGYELDATTGKILQRLAARETKNEWQKAAAWDIRIPDPPEYGPPQGAQ